MEQRAQTWDDKLLSFLLPAFAFAVPISIALAEPIGFVVIAAWFYRAIRLRDATVFRNPFFFPIVTFAFIAAVSVFFSVRPFVTLDKCHRLLLSAVVFAIGCMKDGKADAVPRLAWLFTLGCSLRAIYHVGYVFVSVRRGVEIFETGNMRDPQMYLVALCFLLAAFLQRPAGTRLKAIGAGLGAAALGLLLNFKRGAWIAFVAAALAMTLAARRWRAIVFAAVLVALVAALPQTRARIAMVRDEFSYKMGGRYVLWMKVAPAMLREYPQGMGYAATRNSDFLRHARRVQPWLHHLHNNALQVRLELGWAGLAAWTWWMLTALWVTWRASRKLREAGDARVWLAEGAFGSMVGLLANGMVEYNFGDSEILMLMYLVMGIAAVLYPRERSEST